MYYVYYDDELVAASRSNVELVTELKDANISGQELCDALLELGLNHKIRRDRWIQMSDGARYNILVTVFYADHDPYGIPF